MVWRIYARDIRRAFGSLAMIVLTLALVIIPGLYAWFNIAAAMDPYSHTENLSVAVSNDDRPATLSLGGRTARLEAGKSIVKGLRANHRLGWTFLPRRAALERVRSGESYAAIIIPADFSERLSRLARLPTSPSGLSRPTLHYFVNEKVSAVAPKITDTGTGVLERTINETVVRVASKAVVGQLRKSAARLLNGADSAADSVAQTLAQAAGGLGDARSSLHNLAGTLGGAARSTRRAKKTLGSLGERTQSLSDRLREAQERLPALQRSTISFTTRLPAVVGDGTSALLAASSQAAVTANTLSIPLSGAISQTGSTLEKASSAVREAESSLQTLRGLGGRLRSEGLNLAAGQLSQVTRLVEGHVGRARDLVDSLTASNREAQTTLRDLGNLTEGLSQSTFTAADRASTLANHAAATGSSLTLDALATAGDAAQSGRDALATLGESSTRTQGTLDRLSSTLTSLSTTVGDTANALTSVQKSLTSAAGDIAALSSSQNAARVRDLLRLDAASTADFISSPTRIVTRVFYPVAKYGAALTPLYSNVALWMGSLMLVIMIRMEVDASGLGGRPKDWQAYLGRYLLIGTLALLQGLVITAGDLLTGISVENVPAFLCAGTVEGLVYSSIIYALTVCFQHVGRAIAILLIIMQIPGAAGIYPIEMMPAFYQAMNPWLPWTYGISMMREAIGGMYRLTYGRDLLLLALFSTLAFLAGLGLRGRLINLNLLMDERLASTQFFSTESGADLPRPRVRLTTIVRSLIGTPAWRARVLQRTAAFDRAYPRLIRAAFTVTALVPFIPFALIASPNEKLISLGIWVTIMFLAVAFVILIEYVHRSLNREVGLSHLPASELRELMNERERR